MRTAVEVRWIEESDVESVLGLIASAGFVPRSRVTWDGLAMTGVAAWAGGSLVGAVPLDVREVVVAPGHTVRAGNQTVVAVVPEYRSQGIGAQMQQELVKSGRHDVMTVYREDPESPAYRWYRTHGFVPLQTICSLVLRPPYAPSGRKGATWLSPDEIGPVQGELTRLFSSRTRGFGGFVARSERSLAEWMAVHPYRGTYRFGVIAVEDAYAAVGVGRLHSVGDRLELLDLGGLDDDATYERLIKAVRQYASELHCEYIRIALSTEDPAYGRFVGHGFVDEWSFEMMVRVLRADSVVARVLSYSGASSGEAVAVDSPQLGRIALATSDRPVTAGLDHDAATRLILRRLEQAALPAELAGEPKLADRLRYTPWLFNGIEYA